MITDVTGVLLAGGKSRRMGQDKRFLHVGEMTLFERSLAVLRSVFQDVLVVIAQDSPPLQADVPVIRDLVPDCGSLGGLYTGLMQAATSYVFVVACDMPFLDPRAVQYVAGLKHQGDIVMAKRGEGLQPMHAIYSRRCLPVMEEMLKAHDLKIQKIVRHPTLQVRFITETELSGIDPDGRSFLNVNTPSDLEAARILGAPRTDSRPS
jgi:molybdopterin-guanine dinucleotide biosynthesis protein A